jgi:hypothetical protein
MAGLLLILTLPAPASAESIAAGETRFELDRGLFDVLKSEGVEVASVKQGSVQGRVVTLPIDGGVIDVSTAIGSLDHGGGFKFRSGKRVARLSQLVLDTAQRELYAKIGGKRLRIATLKSYSFSRAGFGDEIEVDGLRLNRGAASLLNRKLHLKRVFRPGRTFAAIASGFEPEADRFTSGSMQFSLDAGTVAKLKSLEVEPVPFETAVLGSNPPTYSGPLLGGDIYPSASRSWGYIEGGIRIDKPEAPGPVLTWINLGLSLESQKVLGFIQAHTEFGQLAPVPGGPIGAIDFSAATVQLDPQARTLSIANARATLEASTANLLNETFAMPKGKAAVFAAGDPLGTFSLAIQAR